MPKEWFQRLWLVLFVVGGSLYLLAPTFFWHPANEGRVGETTTSPTPTAPPIFTNGSGHSIAEGSPAAVTGTSGVAQFPAWMGPFPKKRLRFGLDLVGGSHLALGVDTDEALRAMISGERRDIRERLAKEGIPFESVAQPFGTAQLQVVIKSPSDHSALTDLITTKIDRRLEEQGYTVDKDGHGVATYGFTGAQVEQIKKNAIEQVLQLLRSRTNAFGVSEPRIYQESANRIVVELPSLKDPAQAIENIKRTARLEFRIVDEGFYGSHGGDSGATAYLQQVVQQGLASLPPADQDDDQKLNQVIRAKIPADDVVMFEKETVNNKLVRGRPWLLRAEVALTGDRLDPTGIFPEQDKFGNWEVAFKFDVDGSERFGKLTEENRGKRLAVVLEGAVKTTPNIREKIEGAGVIELGSRNKQDGAKEASTISRVLRTGALPAPVRIEQSQVVGPELGQDSIRRGVEASVLGFTLVFLFAWYWYRWSGFIATIALVANAVVMLSLMTLFDATLTLPGIAGIVLTTGMAVDANVLIYERIREELRLGKNIRAAIEVGFDKAFWTVVDSHMTTALAGVVLYFFGTDQIKGFAVTLLLGIATSLFTALVISRLCFDYWTMKIKPQELSI